MGWVSLFLFFLSMSFSGARAQSLDARLIEVKSKLEEGISNRIKSEIKTSLLESTFEVNTSISLRRKAQPVLMQSSRSSVDPTQTSMGIINTEALIRTYERRLNEEIEDKLRKSSSEPLDLYEISGIRVSVGLNSNYGEGYLQNFNSWLQKKVEIEFGKIAKTEVRLLSEQPLSEVEKSKASPVREFLKEFQNLVATILVVTVALLSLLLSKTIVSKDTLEQRSIAMRLQQQSLFQESETAKDIPNQKPAPALAKLEEAPPINASEVRTIKDTASKVAILAKDLGPSLQSVLNAWIEQGERGQYKLACLMDSVMSSKDFMKTDLNGELNIRFNLDISSSVKDQMMLVFQRMSSLASESRRKLFEEVYWDLVSLKTLGSHVIEKPFGYLQQLSVSEARQILEKQDPNVRSLAVLFMGEVYQEKFLQALSPDEKAEVFTNSVSLQSVDLDDLRVTNEALKHLVSSVKTTGSQIEVHPFINKLLRSLSVVDEITILRKSAVKLGRSLDSIKQSRVTLAFFDEWIDSSAQKLLSLANPSELVALIRLVPAFLEPVRQSASSRVVTIVEDDLRLEGKSTPTEIRSEIESLTKKMQTLIDSKEIDLSLLYRSKTSTSAIKKAA